MGLTRARSGATSDRLGIAAYRYGQKDLASEGCGASAERTVEARVSVRRVNRSRPTDFAAGTDLTHPTGQISGIRRPLRHRPATAVRLPRSRSGERDCRNSRGIRSVNIAPVVKSPTARVGQKSRASSVVPLPRRAGPHGLSAARGPAHHQSALSRASRQPCRARLTQQLRSPESYAAIGPLVARATIRIRQKRRFGRLAASSLLRGQSGVLRAV